jgi:predicted nucleic acid-binding protein
MSVECFLDTNVLIYAAAGREHQERKRLRALQLIEGTDFGLSAQVLQEFYVVVTRKIDHRLSPDRALEWIEQWEAFPCVSIDSGLVKIAAELSERFQISYRDASVVSAAEALGAETLYTEDLNDGQRYGAVRVSNPFLSLT